MNFDKATKHRKSLIPKVGFNLVGIDDYEMPDEALYLIKHSNNYEELVVLKKKKEATGITCYIYSANMA